MALRKLGVKETFREHWLADALHVAAAPVELVLVDGLGDDPDSEVGRA